MTQTHSIRRFAILFAACSSLLLVSHAQAQPRAAQAQRARATKKAPLAKRAAQFRTPRTPSAKLKAKAGKKMIMAVNKNNAKAYEKAMKKDTVEVIFSPRASSYGHIYIRVGDRLLDMPGPSGARNNDFSSQMRWGSSPMYGFSFKVGERKVASLMKEYKRLLDSRPGFGMAAGGSNNCFSCAAFATHILATHAPELKIRKSVSAIGVGRSLLRSDKVHGITLYRQAGDQADRSDFNFEKID